MKKTKTIACVSCGYGARYGEEQCRSCQRLAIPASDDDTATVALERIRAARVKVFVAQRERGGRLDYADPELERVTRQVVLELLLSRAQAAAEEADDDY